MTTFTGNLGDGTTRNYATSMTYTPAGQLTQENFGVNVSANVPNGIWHNTHYNNRLQMTDTRIGTGINDGQGQEWTWNRGAIRMFYAAGNNGNMTRMDHFVPTNEAASTYAMSVDYYGYDHLNRITGIWENKQAHNLGETTTNLTQQYTYDQFGNRLVNNAVSTFPVQNSPYTVVTAKNQLQSAGNCMTFDAVGNLIDDCGRTRVYDGNNKTISAYDAGVATSYHYNADGQRTIKTVGTVSTWNIYGMGGELVAEYPANGAVGSPQKEYGYRGAQMLVVYDSTETGNKQFQWLVQDHLGSTRMVMDLSGSLSGMKRHDYLPFGEEIPISGIRTTAQGYPPPDDKIRQKFTGYEKDTETGLDYAQARYYSNAQGRFTSPDPLFFQKEMRTDPQRFNLYSYVRNNPTIFNDPTGKEIEVLGDENQRESIRQTICSGIGGSSCDQLVINSKTVKGKTHYYLGIRPGEEKAFNKTNGLARAISRLVSDDRVAIVSLASQGQKVEGYFSNQTAKIGRGEGQALGYTAPNARQPTELMIWILDPSSKDGQGRYGLLSGLMTSDGVSFNSSASEVIFHELGHVYALWYPSMYRQAGLFENQMGAIDRIALDFENAVRLIHDPNAGTRVLHNPEDTAPYHRDNAYAKALARP